MTLNNVSSYHPQYWSLGIKKNVIMFNVHKIAVSFKMKQKIQKHYRLSSIDQKYFSQRVV